ncbi:neuroblastoma-amplified sequence-like [Trichogramma pretiosum]|uniref:neuroblastoma-amplified sequence-like n=1 Tax=Trichogramma pretiosum TaxID=7493 RepID=UPI0006C95621|nr:neuroblastoma-amplified sequence-like [Trichogramma pretiosum]
MIEENLSESNKEPILYEVLEYFVRKQEPELLRFKNDTLLLPTTGTIKNALRYLNNRYSLPESISLHVGYTLPWKFAIGNQGRVLAILQENIIEIRRSKDEYSTISGKASAPKDPFPEWRKMAWSPDGSILALASSNGYVSFYNSFGNNIFNITPKSMSQDTDILEAGDATASMIFKKPRVESEKWNYEFIRVTYSGLLKSYCISSNSFSENHIFSFGNFYRNGVSSVCYSEKHNLFYVAGNFVCSQFSCSASQIGLTCWRTLNDQPYYTLAVSSQDIDMYKSNFSIWNFIPMIKSRAQSIIFKITISPNNKLIACLHTDGMISVWSMPNLKLQKQWKLHEQPNYNAVNPLKTTKLKKLVNISEYQPLDIGWWSDDAIIIARYSGSISVCSVSNLKNLLGINPEFLYSHPQIAELEPSKGFLCLDCEMLITSTKKYHESTIDEMSENDKDDDEVVSFSILSYFKTLIQSTLYSITDIEHFQPKRKKSKIFYRTYRLIGLKSRTPEELYAKKMEIEEYEEALNLAKTYNLDPDLVYQTQWRKSGFSMESIHEHLSKVSKRLWVLDECISRVPETLEATRELLNFGLQGTNLETLSAIGENDSTMDIIKFTQRGEDNDNDLDDGDSQLKKIQKMNKILETITQNTLSKSQKQLMQYRKKILDHLDKLQTYEIFIGSQSKFDKDFYTVFRSSTPVENAVKFAKSGDVQGVEIMFSYYGAYLIPHWLMIISYFPETLHPEKYRKLLPECDGDGRLFLLYQKEIRPKDWVERSDFSAFIDLETYDDANYIYEEKNSYLVYRNKELTQDLLQKWYKNRAYEIEHDSRLVDNALALVNIGKSHNIQNLENTIFELETLDDLVYKIGLEELSLTELEKLNDLEKMKLLMSKADEDSFVYYLKTILLPYSRRRKRYLGNTLEKDVLYDYLVHLSKRNLIYAVKFFEYLKSSCDSEVIDTFGSITLLAMDCIYACDDIDMYSKGKSIFDSISNHLSGQEESSKLYKELEKELKTLMTLNKYGVKIPLHQIKICRQNNERAKDLLLSMSENLVKIYNCPNEKNWTQLLNDMLDIQEQVLNCIDIEICFEICMVARLKSKSKASIQGCINLIEVKKKKSSLKVSYERAIQLILQASNDYFNNSQSLMDPEIDLARECLQLISFNEKTIKEEYDLLESLQILHEFNVDILPIQVRMTQDKLKLINDCLDSKLDAYKNKQKLLNLAEYLRVENRNSKLRENKVLSLIARKAYEIRDYVFCSTVVKQMMKNNYQAAWNIALDLAYCDDYPDLQCRLNCIWFAVSNGPSNMIEDLLKRANLLQVQILNIELQNLVPTDNDSSDNDEEENSNTAKEESRKAKCEDEECRPNIVQTSTDLVKSSAQKVTQSTFELIRNAGNTNFWKSKLNFSFTEAENKYIKQEEIIDSKASQKNKQKFFCFYETLNENFGISTLNTKYSKYSKVDTDNKLQLYQTLMRISLLSENASCGTEISDINHLLLDCAKYTILEDCNLGLSYILNINDESVSKVTELFEISPSDTTFTELLIYFSALKLYLRMAPKSDEVFSYDPNELIKYIFYTKSSSLIEQEKILIENMNLLLNAKTQTEETNVQITIHANKNEIENTFTVVESKKEFDTPVNVIYMDESKKINSDLLYQPEAADGWSDDWGDEWVEESNDIQESKYEEAIDDETNHVEELKDEKVLNLIEESKNEEVVDDAGSFIMTEVTENYLIPENDESFEQKWSKIQNIDDFREAKQIIFQKLKEKNLNTDDNEIYTCTWKMLTKLVNIDSNSSIATDIFCQEIKDFLQKGLTSTDILVKFLNTEESILTPEQNIYLKLCSKQMQLQKNAIDFIKLNYESLSLNSIILEEIFFNNLTSSFAVNHDLYNKILEVVFENQNLFEIETNVKILIDHLIKNQHISHAIALLNQLEGIPPALSTYENCFKLLLKK